jgi:beta-phosphoglucomutase-like phosphatase (HAD superfamily)
MFTSRFYKPFLALLIQELIYSSLSSSTYAFEIRKMDQHKTVQLRSSPLRLNDKIQGIIFDLDGTLLDTETLSDHAMFAALNISPNDIPHYNGKASDGRLPWELKRQILGLRSSDWGPIVMNYAQNVWGISSDSLPSSSEELAASWEEHLNEYCSNVQVCNGAYELVQKLSVLQLPMAIATSSRQSAVEKKRKNHSALFQHIPTIVCGDHPNVKRGKPAPDIYIEAAQQMNVLPQHCLVFEDAMNGIQSAKAAGCGCVVAIPDSRYEKEELETFQNNADMVIPDLWHFNGTTIGVNVNQSL